MKWLGILAAASTVAVGVFFVGMRFHDGPIEIIAGGPFKTGEVTSAPDDWTFLTDRGEIEFQTMDPATSRTVWLAVHDQRLFVVSGYMTTGYGKLWKQWPHYLDDDDQVILRIDGKLYEQRLQRVLEGPDIVPVLNEFGRKYGFASNAPAATISEGHVWMFEVVPR